MWLTLTKGWDAHLGFGTAQVLPLPCQVKGHVILIKYNMCVQQYKSLKVKPYESNNIDGMHTLFRDA